MYKAGENRSARREESTVNKKCTVEAGRQYCKHKQERRETTRGETAAQTHGAESTSAGRNLVNFSYPIEISSALLVSQMHSKIDECSV